MSDTVSCSLLPTEADLAVARFTIASITHKVLESDLLIFRAQYVRQNRIGRNLVTLGVKTTIVELVED